MDPVGTDSCDKSFELVNNHPASEFHLSKAVADLSSPVLVGPSLGTEMSMSEPTNEEIKEKSTFDTPSMGKSGEGPTSFNSGKLRSGNGHESYKISLFANGKPGEIMKAIPEHGHTPDGTEDGGEHRLFVEPKSKGTNGAIKAKVNGVMSILNGEIHIPVSLGE